MVLKRREPRGSLTAGGFTVSVDLYVGGDKWSHQPRPYRSLMIGAVTLGRPARVSPTVLGIAWRKAAHVVICVGVQFLAILIKPGLFGVVMGSQKTGKQSRVAIKPMMVRKIENGGH